MGLISLLISLAAERKLSASFWHFNFTFSKYMAFAKSQNLQNAITGQLFPLALLVVPPLITFIVFSAISDTLIHLVLSTVVLIVCFGCVKTRDTYKQYLRAAFRGDLTTSQLHYEQLLSDKNLTNYGFGQTLVWLNYRYYIAVMLYFVVFGPVGAVFYRLLCALEEQQQSIALEDSDSPALTGMYRKVLFWADWLPVRIATFGLMMVGHFSKGFPHWVENLFDFSKSPQCVLIDVAQQSEDIMVDKDDCTAEPCLLVRLAKRNVLLLLAVVAVLILTGIIS
ncbi:beta-lactamase regulator AmpE [Thalassotalea euphylliae]|uniref:beta-lactamase regulator AmpE n=1 Tax=Thalassotalea euphylliae TaxID=1655234 RepID=UPI003636BB08